MHLKSIEMIGFKSFADRTKLEFEPGMIAIVGPNGCGKSNVSDAIRWVLGEQRPTALRGSKMLDVIFSGTDARKPLGMAEVSISFADCEGTLATEFNEVTVTRRVFRAGEGEYFINKTPCRLRDIHRLFMGTGIGTTSYSVMAQGQIDAILSSKPEDRRAIFEEAAGITKFKADRKEALRKLEQTDANLLRLADVIREVKRQIGSLQRQAGRARRYQELRAELRGIDLYVTRRRLAALDQRLRDGQEELAAAQRREAGDQARLAAAEQANAAVHAAILENERQIGAATEAAAQDEGRLQHAREMIAVSEQRIAEYRSWSARDTQEASETQRQLEALQTRRAELLAERDRLACSLAAARSERDDRQRRADAERRALDARRQALQSSRDEALERERRAARLQNQLAAMETQQREASLQRARLTAEHEQLTQSLKTLASGREGLAAELAGLRGRADEDGARLQRIENERQAALEALRSAQEEHGRLQSQLAARRAQIDLLAEQEARAEEFQSGSRLLLDGDNPLRLDAGAVLGPLADKFSASTEFRPALEAVLRAWIDAVVLRRADDAAAVVRRLLEHGGAAAARLIAAEGVASPARATARTPAGLARLRDHIEVAPDFTEAADRLLATVYVAKTLDDVPRPMPPDCTVVTLGGAVFHADGCSELWMAEGQSASPLARRMAIADGRERIGEIERQLAVVKTRLADHGTRQQELTAALAEARRALDDSRRQAAQKEGEWQTVTRDAERARQRHEVAARELEMVVARTQQAEEQRQALTAELGALLAGRERAVEALAAEQQALQADEQQHAAHGQELTDARLREAHLAQQSSHHAAQIEAHATRAAELERQLQGRSQGVQSYEQAIGKLTAQIEEAQAQIAPMLARADQSRRQLETLRKDRAARARELERSEAELATARRALDEARAGQAHLEVELAEARVRRQNHFERVQAEYGLKPDQLVAEPDPDWGANGAPDLEQAEAEVARLAGELQAMGPVNMVAIEEYKELEERHAFLKAQEDDMLRSKEQILDLLRMINKKTSELFQATFESANANFERTFTKLFNGGTARLLLLENPEDPLECGVEIIARPPGKRLQSISLLSGGERTMTAVSLLFAIYMIKPSPFCMLDELDAALDDSNIGRFVQALKDFLTQSQFLLITHNPHTIASSHLVYGVTMPEKGVSKVVSMRLPDIGVRKLEIATEAPAPEPPTLPPKRRRGKAATAGDSEADAFDSAPPTAAASPAPPAAPATTSPAVAPPGGV